MITLLPTTGLLCIACMILALIVDKIVGDIDKMKARIRLLEESIRSKQNTQERESQ